MNKDIKVLKNFIDKQKSNKGTFVPTDFEITAIENLIKRNKELEEIFRQFNAIHKDKIFVKEIPYELIIADTRYFMSGTFYDNFISKSKIREKIEELNNIYQQEIKQKYKGRYYQQLSYAIQILKELEGDK